MAILGRTAGDYSYTQTQALRHMLRTSLFHGDIERDVVNIGDIYTYFEDVIFPIVFRETRINGSRLNDPRLRYYINTHNARILGGVRIKRCMLSAPLVFLYLLFVVTVFLTHSQLHLLLLLLYLCLKCCFPLFFWIPFCFINIGCLVFYLFFWCHNLLVLNDFLLFFLFCFCFILCDSSLAT